MVILLLIFTGLALKSQNTSIHEKNSARKFYICIRLDYTVSHDDRMIHPSLIQVRHVGQERFRLGVDVVPLTYPLRQAGNRRGCRYAFLEVVAGRYRQAKKGGLRAHGGCRTLHPAVSTPNPTAPRTRSGTRISAVVAVGSQATRDRAIAPGRSEDFVFASSYRH